MTKHSDYLAPAGLRTRGTVIVVPGRGETPATYARLGARLAYDAYRVRVTEAPAGDPADLAAFLVALGEQLTAAVAGADLPDGVPRPLVLLGADLGAAALAALLARSEPGEPWWPDAAVLAGLPAYHAQLDGGWEDEADSRSHCPVHRGVLDADPAFRPGALGGAVPDQLLDAAYGSTAGIPQLLLAGDSDPLADPEALARAAKALPAARLVIVREAHHDVLNDLQHRSVAAETVLFLETVRGGLAPATAVESSSW